MAPFGPLVTLRNILRGKQNASDGSDAARRLAGLAQADVDSGPEAYSEARQRERDVALLNGTTHASRTPAHWRRVALIVARMTGKRIGVDAATRMLE